MMSDLLHRLLILVLVLASLGLLGLLVRLPDVQVWLLGRRVARQGRPARRPDGDVRVRPGDRRVENACALASIMFLAACLVLL